MKFLFSVLLTILCPSALFACMCGNTAVCDAYADSDAIVVAEVVSYKEANVPMIYENDSGTRRIIEVGQEVKLKVSKWFKGKGGSRITLLQPSSSCDWSFDDDLVKKRFLFYLDMSRANGHYAIRTCGRSSSYEKAASDLSWLNNLPYSLKRTRIAGTTELSDGEDTFPPVSGVQVSIVGKENSYALKSNAKGFYEIWDVTPGKYRVSSLPPQNMLLRWTVSTPEDWTYFWTHGDSDLKALDVSIEAGKCGGVDFMFGNK